ncbi:hypothetical protein ACRAWC_14650 [Leifsonia sp. L25]|uniref:alpha-L-rhamnosidase-related protein n=1 Tax=Actinomycetes TaxID=1760 RepID=UPI003D6912C4
MNLQTMSEHRPNPGRENYLTPGRHIQLIGSQNGGFPPFGHHVPNEMGGVWMHPVKLLDGFWLGVQTDGGGIDWLTDAVRFSNHVFYNAMTFERETYTVERREYSAQSFPGLIVEFSVTNRTAEPLELDGVLAVRSDLRPVWSESGEIVDAPDDAWADAGDFVGRDREQEWFVRCRIDGVDGELSLPDQPIAGDEVFGPGASGVWQVPLAVAPGETRTFALKITGSLTAAAETLDRMNRLADPQELFAEKRDHYAAILARSDIEVPDKELEKQYAWSKCHIEWLTISSEPVGTGLAAGIPEYVWWFSVDSVYALKGCLPAGFHDLAEQTIAIIDEGSRRANGNGRIIHEENSYGEVGNRGNTQETALFVHAVSETYSWTGDRDWLASYWPAVQAALRYLLDDCMPAGSLFPVGNGIMEVRGLTGELIDTAVYTQVALADAGRIAALLGDSAAEAEYSERADAMATEIRTTMWQDDDGLFADIRSDRRQLLDVFDELIESAHRDDRRDLVARYTEAKRGFVADQTAGDGDSAVFSFKNWVILTPIEMGLASDEQAGVALSRLDSPEFVGEWGAYLSGSGDDRIMTISSAVHINSNLAYGRADEALDVVRRVMATFNRYLPGSISEMSPDYGCFVQAWTAYAMIAPVITGFIGLRPDAGAKRLRIDPCLPSDWDSLSARNVLIGDDSFDIEVRREGDDSYSVSVSGATDGWTISTAHPMVMAAR